MPVIAAASVVLDAPDGERIPWRGVLSPLRNGGFDPTTRFGPGEMIRATFTPDGPGTVRLRWRSDGGAVQAEAWGPGGHWLLGRAPAMLGLLDPTHLFAEGHPLVLRAQHLHPPVRIGASGGLYHELLPTILAQRITAGEAVRQWRLLCLRLGEPAPGPFPELRLPPAPERLARMPTWWFHPLGVERSRASTLVEVARHADKLWDWAQLPAGEAGRRLTLLSGVGEWTVGMVLASALGEPDAIAVGDYHLKNVVAWNLAREPRASDERMLELLEPYRGHRGRVVRLIHLEGDGAPKRGPRQRVLPMHRW